MKPIAVLVTGFMLLASGVGLATDHGNVVALSSPSANAMGGIHKSLPLPRPSSLLHPNNSTTTAPTATTLRTIYTSSPNVTVQPLSMRIYNLTAYVDKQAKHAHYEFSWVVEPDFHAVRCRATVPSTDGKLENIEKARCRQADPRLPTTRDDHHKLQHESNRVHPASMAPLSSFAWKQSENTSSLLILRSSNPASAHHCPDFPRDACWAQGLYPIGPRDFEWVDGVQRYIGREYLSFPGTYCKTDMGGCAWSQYIY